MSEIISSLEVSLSELRQSIDRKDMKAWQITNDITGVVCEVLKRHGFSVECEAKIPLQRSGIRKTGKPYFKNGRVDIIGTNSGGVSVAIEIDRANKKWSLEKLIYCHEELEMNSVWLRWKGKLMPEIPDFITVFDIANIEIHLIKSKYA